MPLALVVIFNFMFIEKYVPYYSAPSRAVRPQSPHAGTVGTASSETPEFALDSERTNCTKMLTSDIGSFRDHFDAKKKIQ